MGKVIGIDLGTTNSVVAVMEGGEPKIITNEEGGRTTPSVVAFNDKGETLVGQVARRQSVVNPERTLFSVKRLIGRRYAEAKRDAERLPYRIVEAPNGDAHVEVDGKRMSPPEVSAKVLAKLKRAAENYLGHEVTEAVITVPAYFNDSQRQATKDAGRIAGLDVKRIINEPTAAALAYGLDRKTNERIAVYDFGGGTFDISLLEVGDGVVEVVATNGDTHLGGDDVDDVLVDHLVAEFRKETGVDLSKDRMALQRLREAAEKAKIELSSTMETEINLPFLTADASGPKHMLHRLERSQFERLVEAVVQRTVGPCRKALADAGKSPEDIDEVVLVGGSTRIPRVQQLVEQFFGKKPHLGVNPDEVVAAGAAIQGGVLAGEVKDVLLLDVTPLSLGIETLGGVNTVLIPRNTTIPTRKSEIFSTADDGQTAVTVHVLQGEREVATGNRSLGRFNLEGIAAAPRGAPQIEVAFDIDANGILNVSATDQGSGKAQKITVTANSGLDGSEIERLVREGTEHAEEDRRRREEVEQRNRADAFTHQAEATFREHGDLLGPDERAGMDEALADAKAALKKGDAAEIRATQERLQGLAHQLGERLYRRQAETGPEGDAADEGWSSSARGTDDGAGGNRGGDDVIDAEVL